MRVVVVYALAGCGFPSVTFSDAAASDAQADVSADVATEHVDPPVPDAGPDSKPVLMDSGNPCDMDDDKAASDTCQGADCDDTDPRANPGVTAFQYFAATPQTKGDWNCDRTIETLYPTVNLKCSDYTSNCTSLAGFETNPPCGSFANYVTCKAGGLLQPCAVDTQVMKQQGCK